MKQRPTDQGTSRKSYQREKNAASACCLSTNVRLPTNAMQLIRIPEAMIQASVDMVTIFSVDELQSYLSEPFARGHDRSESAWKLRSGT